MRYFDKNTWFWIVVGALFFIPFLGGVHLFDWDEINFAELAREMVVTGDWLRLQINYEIFTEKPPLFFWLQAISMKIFGVGEFAARFPNALLGAVVLPWLYVSGKFLVDRKFGFLWALSWFGSLLPFLYFKSGIIDPWFNFFIFNGLFFLIHFFWKKSGCRNLYFSKSATAYLWMAGIFTGLAVLTKGPVGYLLIFLSILVYWVLQKFKWQFSFLSFLKFSLIALLIFSLWFLLDFLLNGPDFIIEFTIRQWELLTTGDAGHSGFFGYHFVVLLVGCFPASILAVRGLGRFQKLPAHLADFQKWMIILLGVVVVLFSLVGTKIVHYSSLAYYPITFLSALSVWNFLEKKRDHKKWFAPAIIFIGILIAAVSAALPWAGMHPEKIRFLFEKDAFAMANLQAEVDWHWWDFTAGIWLIVVLIIYGILLKINKFNAYRALFFGSGIWVMLTLILFIGKIEKISQNANVEFFEKFQDKDVYVTTFGYKSYVPWFYAKVKPPLHPEEKPDLMFGETDRPVLISTKITQRENLEKQIPDAKFLYEKNGFVFYQRN